ncbi:hypothetical protein LVY72_20775 [Arthrobacter sp. I2-34]|uniref:Uncharacterized protein n=1 Tax=Arthrobacter hankyongi TaxID=2904801 RepID=A0ABS9LCW9_9MICC|nr:hypothetical protein [Arthrobacter hankyongi]MCG2624329.1 hypothetical protein [Arthrobacter hankyongi]
MSSMQYDDSPIRTLSGPVRVFRDVAPTPRTPAPQRWNHPVGVLLAMMGLAVLITFVPVLPPTFGLFTGLAGFVLAVLSMVSRWWWWADSRERAVAEAVWVARQSGYRIDADGGQLRWLDQDGRVKRAAVVRGDGGWNLMLCRLAA